MDFLSLIFNLITKIVSYIFFYCSMQLKVCLYFFKDRSLLIFSLLVDVFMTKIVNHIFFDSF